MPTTVPRVCEDLTKLTATMMNELPVSNVKITPTPASKQGNFEFSSPAGTTTIEFSMKLEKEGLLETLRLDGTFNSYQVFTASGPVKVGPVKNDAETLEKFGPGSSNIFNKKVPEDYSITLVITGPSTGFVVNITEFRVCLPEFRYCQLTQTEVLQRLKYLPMGGILGVSQDDKQEVNYGLNMAHGDILEEGVVVKGHCYECECVNFTLVCRIDENCNKTCPNYTTRCEGTCDNPVLIVEFDVEGVDPKCRPNDTCTPDGCTTPNCPGPWAEWTDCTDCVRTRQRTCPSGCGNCNNQTTTQSEACGSCITTTTTTTTTTTPYTTPYVCDGDNEEWKCYNHYIKCNETCRSLYNLNACASLKQIDQDVACNYSCGCKDGYKKNAKGACVKEEECECYNGTIALPVNYRENISACKYCECKMNEGYKCHEIEDCCTTSEWEEWSSCSVTCGDGVRTRTRRVTEGNCNNRDLTETKKCNAGACPCVIDGKVWQSGDRVDYDCKYCKCYDGVLGCTPKNITEPWRPYCNQTCYCAKETGEKICVNEQPKCELKDPSTCNNDTHYTVPDPKDKCCEICKPKVPVCSRKTVEKKKLTFTHKEHGLCISPMLNVSKCEGSCGTSKSGGNHYAYQRPGADLPVFDVDYYSDCSCCQAKLQATEVKFRCDKTDAYVTIRVTQIASCECNQCT